MLVSAGNVKRDRIQRIKSSGDSNLDETSIADNLPEQEVSVALCVDAWKSRMNPGCCFLIASRFPDPNSVGVRNHGAQISGGRYTLVVLVVERRVPASQLFASRDDR